MKTLRTLYIKGPAAYGSLNRLTKHSGISKRKVQRFLQSEDAYTRLRGVRFKFPRLKVIAFHINEIWSMDLADVSKLSKSNKNTRYLLVAVDVLSRFKRVQPMINKTAEVAADAFKKMLKNNQPQKVWVDKGTEFKGAFKKLCDNKGIEIYSTHSETKSAFAERAIRSLKNIMSRDLVKNNTETYYNHLSDYVDTMNNRVNRIIGKAPAHVTNKDVSHLVSLSTNVRLVRKPKLQIGDAVRIAEENLPFRKGYKPNFTFEKFRITNIATVNPPTYRIEDTTGEEILGKFYEPELSKVIDG